MPWEGTEKKQLIELCETHRKLHFYQFKTNTSKARVKPKNSMLLAKLEKSIFLNKFIENCF